LPCGVMAAVLEIDSGEEDECQVQDAFALELAKQLRPEDETGLPKTDEERMPREMDPYPPLPDPALANLSEERAKAAAQLRKKTEEEAAAALGANDVQKAVDAYSLAMKTSGATAMMLANRAALLLKLKRPCSCIRDCTAAIKISGTMVKAFRVRAIAHRKLGHWRKSLSDVAQAQELKFDEATGEMHKFLTAQVSRLDGGKEKPAEKVKEKRKRDRSRDRGRGRDKKSSAPNIEIDDTIEMSISAVALAPPPNLANDLTKGQAVVVEGLTQAPHLNGKCGVVERMDPRPAAKGRWEVEIRLNGGRVEVKSLKRDNIAVLNKADREACKVWAQAEKRHKMERKQREECEEENKYRKCVEAKMAKFPSLSPEVLELLRKIRYSEQLTVLDKVDEKVVNVNEFLKTQVALITGQDDSDEEVVTKKSRG